MTETKHFLVYATGRGVKEITGEKAFKLHFKGRSLIVSINQYGLTLSRKGTTFWISLSQLEEILKRFKGEG